MRISDRINRQIEIHQMETNRPLKAIELTVEQWITLQDEIKDHRLVTPDGQLVDTSGDSFMWRETMLYVHLPKGVALL
jgi:hypothetical protein